MTGSTASLSSSAPLGALLHRPFHCLNLLQERATSPMERLHHLCIKMLSSQQGARSRGVTRHARRPCTKKEAVKKSLGRKKTLLRSQHHCVKAARRLLQRRVDIMIRLRLHDGPR